MSSDLPSQKIPRFTRGDGAARRPYRERRLDTTPVLALMGE
jgi:hypothetical protein